MALWRTLAVLVSDMPQSMPDKRKGTRMKCVCPLQKEPTAARNDSSGAFGYHLGWFTQKWYPFRHHDLADRQTRSSSLAPLLERRQVQGWRFQ
jgi:hypothetical protein